jgi:hypothetical protein
MPVLIPITNEEILPNIINDELSYDKNVLLLNLEIDLPKLNADQRIVYDTIINRLNSNETSKI